MNLLFSIDDNYTKQFLIALYSILENTSFKDIDVYVLQEKKYFS